MTLRVRRWGSLTYGLTVWLRNNREEYLLRPCRDVVNRVPQWV